MADLLIKCCGLIFILGQVVFAHSQISCSTEAEIAEYCTCQGDSENEPLTVTCQGLNQTTLNLVIAGISPNSTALEILDSDLVTLEEGVFNNSTTKKLETLQLKNSSFVIEKGTFLGLDALKTLAISLNRNITNFPSLTGFPRLTGLYVTNNTIETISVDAFAAIRNVGAISLAGNQIRSLPEGIFKAQVNLKELTLDDNTIDEVNGKTFQGLKAIEKLSLNGNAGLKLSDWLIYELGTLKELNISNLSPRAPLALHSFLLRGSKLRSLDLRNNSLEKFPAAVLQYVAPTLKRLDISRNNIKELDPSVFEGFAGLTYLDLSYNSLGHINKGTFNLLAGMEKLRLKQNNLTRVENNTFHGLTNITTLDLGDNTITACDRDAFQELATLKKLYLNSNLMQSIKNGLFRNLPVLLIIDFDENGFKTLEPVVLADLVRTTTKYGIPEVTFHDNPIVCNCSMKIFKDWMSQHMAGIHPLISCASPENLKDKFVDEVTDEEYGCSKPVISNCCHQDVAMTLPGVLTVTCAVTGNPKPDITFHKISGNPFPPGFTTFSPDGTSVTINVTWDTSGVFSCVATNLMGQSESFYRLYFHNSHSTFSALWIGLGLGLFIVFIVVVSGLCYIFITKKACWKRKRGEATALFDSGHDRIT